MTFIFAKPPAVNPSESTFVPAGPPPQRPPVPALEPVFCEDLEPGTAELGKGISRKGKKPRFVGKAGGKDDGKGNDDDKGNGGFYGVRADGKGKGAYLVWQFH